MPEPSAPADQSATAPSARRRIVAGNWKMHGTLASLERFALRLSERTLSERTGSGGSAQDAAEVLLFPAAVHLDSAVRCFRNQPVAIGGQDLHPEANGAHTGEVSGEMLYDLGARWVLVGHSERRSLHGEDNALVVRKLIAALRAGLHPVLCVGETLAEREADAARTVVGSQLGAALDAVGAAAFAEVTVAYEPVWAIGTGVTATPAQAQEMHAAIRAQLANAAPELANSLRILYGGSVKPDNAAELFAAPDIDGALIGGASLVADSFADIIAAANQTAA
ncbi:MAG: triose-phosphate isomerase [Pseudomonadales bacterium]